MTAPVAWSDPTSLTAIRQDARRGDAAGLREVAKQFESLFLRMMLKSMREASLGDPMFDSNEGGMYRDMLDDQVAVDMSQSGSMGLAELLVRQLAKTGVAPAPAPAPATATVQVSAQPSNLPTRETFVEKMWPLAVAAGRTLGVDPKHVIAQAALETGWGRSPIGNNYFGIKGSASWQGATTQAATQEYVNGDAQVVSEKFRAYATAEDSVRDYVRLLGGSQRYATVRGTGADTVAFADAIQASGYATDPAYATKLQAVVQVVNGMLPAVLKTGKELPITPVSTPP